jgi:hypothetical protein
MNINELANALMKENDRLQDAGTPTNIGVYWPVYPSSAKWIKKERATVLEFKIGQREFTAADVLKPGLAAVVIVADVDTLHRLGLDRQA